MKKYFFTMVILVSFLMGNASMVVALVKLFGMEAIKPVVNDLIFQKMTKVLYGEPYPRRGGLGPIVYDRPDLRGKGTRISKTSAVMAGIPQDDSQVGVKGSNQ